VNTSLISTFRNRKIYIYSKMIKDLYLKSILRTFKIMIYCTRQLWVYKRVCDRTPRPLYWIQNLAPAPPNGDTTAFVQRFDNLSARCGVASKYAYTYQICQKQRAHDVSTACTRRSQSVLTASMTLVLRCEVAANSVFTALILF